MFHVTEIDLDFFHIISVSVFSQLIIDFHFQGAWYPPAPIQMSMPIQTSGTAAPIAPPASTPSYGNYVVPDTDTVNAPFTQNEP